MPRAAQHNPAQDNMALTNLSVLQAALGATRSAIIITDNGKADNPIMYANQAFLDLTGYKHSEVMGHNCRFLQGPATDPAAVSRLRAAVKDGKHIQITLRNYRKDGTPFWNDLIMSPIHDKTGRLTHFIGLQLDVTDRIDYENALVTARNELKRSNAELEQFAHAASHDLQEPLRMVSSFLQLLEQRYSETLGKDGREFIGYAVEGASRMQTLVNDLLALSRVRTKARPQTKVDLNEAYETAALNLKQAIEDEAAAVTADTLPEIMTDGAQIVQVLQNLISNAIKYHAAGVKPEVHIWAERHGTDWHIGVRDNGIGIDPEYHKRIMTVFQRLHTREEYPGTGIGLAICDKIINRLGGRLWVESALGEGATFWFSLPAGKETYGTT